MSIKTVPTCNDCNEEMTNFELFLERKYPRGRGYFVCSKCQKVRDKKTIKELADSISDLSFYDYPKTIFFLITWKLKNVYYSVIQKCLRSSRV